ncbi:MAG: glutamate--tRNA ligase [Actinobacteria bacterium]|nr:glutamate--tRNA ligase [Actinomycetota bacterium]
MSDVRCRFAPAPSGSIHVGNARSALFSWAFARHHGGTFVLRVEDTDAGRVSEEAFHGVMESLRWLGIDWDEGPDIGGPHGPYRQSQRGDLYDLSVRQLLEQEDAYPCYCTPEELEERRRAAQAAGRPPGYDGRCRTLSDEDRAIRVLEGRPKVIRFAMPQRDLVVQDLVKGDVHFAAGAMQDFVLVRSDGSPVFLLAVAVDDMLMGMTHVIRGEDLLASAPRNAAVIEALGGTPPRYGHLPLLVGADRQPLSKRHGSTSVEAFQEQGFLPEALVNYLALLGWSKDAETTFLTRHELVAAFDLSRVSSNPAAFDTKKLEWMNNHYIQRLDHEELAARCLHFLTAAGLSPDLELLRRAMPLVRERMKRLTDSVELLTFLFTDDVELDQKALAIVAKASAGYLGRVGEALKAVDPWVSAQIQAGMDALAEREGLSRKNAFQPVRAAVTGSTVSPPLPESMELLGRERTLERLGRS